MVLGLNKHGFPVSWKYQLSLFNTKQDDHKIHPDGVNVTKTK